MENFDKTNKKDRQLDNLINLVENHTRTERHLEQYSHIGDQENKEHARKIQEVREDEIENLRDKLNGDIQTREKQIENLEEKYERTEGYIYNNRENIDEEDLQNIEEKQERRREQLDNLKDY